MLAARRAMQMQTFMSELFQLANPAYMGKPAATVPELLQKGILLLPEFIHDPADRQAARLSFAKSMFEADDLVASQKVFADVIEQAKKTGDLAQLAEAEVYAGTIAARRGEPGWMELQADAVRLSHSRGITPSARVQIFGLYAINRSIRGYRKTPEDESLLRAAVAESRANGLPEREQAWVLNLLANYLVGKGDFGGAKIAANQALAIYMKESYALCDQAALRTVLANIQSLSGDPGGSIPYYRQANTDFRTCAGEVGQNTLVSGALLARALTVTGQASEAIPLLESSLSIYRKAYPSNPDLVLPLVYLGQAYIQTSQFEKAESGATEAFQLTEGKINRNSSMAAVIELTLAQALKGEGRFAEAKNHAELSDKEYAAAAPLPPSQKLNAEQAHQLMLDLQKQP